MQFLRDATTVIYMKIKLFFLNKLYIIALES